MSKRILIAEDDEAILEVLRIILENEGYKIIATDTDHGIKKAIKETPPDLMLLDIWLSGYDGGKIAKEMKIDKDTKHIPIIMLSANNDTEKIAKEVGAEGFLQKPFDIADLLAIVHKHTK